MKKLLELDFKDALNTGKLIITKLLNIKPNEKVLIIADSETNRKMIESLISTLEHIGAEYMLSIIPRKLKDHTTLPSIAQKCLSEADVVIGLTKASAAPSYDPEVARLLKEKKIRYMSMVLRDLSNWTEGAALADYDIVYEKAKKLSNALQNREVVELESESGTKLRALMKNSRIIIEAGFATKPGESAAFSDGEVSFTPTEGTAEGTVVIDGPITYLGKLSKPLKLTIKKGKVVNVEGGKEAETIKKWLKEVENFNNFAEIGIGVNYAARKNGDWQEEKKKEGNIHIALGDNIYYGGTIKCNLHVDMVIYNATLKADGETIVKNGKLLI